MEHKHHSILMMAGGTGGHVFPALAIAMAFKSQGATVNWLGTSRGLESKLLLETDIPLHVMPVRGLRGKRYFNRLKAPFTLLTSFIKAVRVINKIKPTVVIGMGGYVSGPGGLAAKLLRKRLVIHEQNAIPGLTNKLLKPFATQVLYAFDGTFAQSDRVRCVGNPVRKAICEIAPPEARYALHTGKLRILIVGGSQGARAINQVVPEALCDLESEVAIWHQTGPGDATVVQAEYESRKMVAKVMPFISNMAKAYAWADLIICRAGALTISELMAIGLPAIFIPYPYATDDHQTRNAEVMVSNGSARLLLQKDLSAASLTAAITSMGNRLDLQKMAKKAYNSCSKNATQRVIDICITSL